MSATRPPLTLKVVTVSPSKGVAVGTTDDVVKTHKNQQKSSYPHRIGDNILQESNEL